MHSASSLLRNIGQGNSLSPQQHTAAYLHPCSPLCCIFFFINSSVLGVVDFVGSWHPIPGKDLVLLWNHFYWLRVGSLSHSYWLYGWALQSESLPKVCTTWNPWLRLAKWPFIMQSTLIQPSTYLQSKFICKVTCWVWVSFLVCVVMKNK